MHKSKKSCLLLCLPATISKRTCMDEIASKSRRSPAFGDNRAEAAQQCTQQTTEDATPLAKK